MADVTFRDFAGAVMKGDDAAAQAVLQTLLELAPDPAAAATAHFRSRMTEPAFMAQAMGLRTAVTSGSDDEIEVLLEACFGLVGDARTHAVAALRRRYQPG